jgi:hypothetical protein
MKLKIASTTLCFLLFTAQDTFADTYGSYTLVNSKLDNGGVVTGNFTVDYTARTMISYDIFVTGEPNSLPSFEINSNLPFLADGSWNSWRAGRLLEFPSRADVQNCSLNSYNLVQFDYSGDLLPSFFSNSIAGFAINALDNSYPNLSGSIQLTSVVTAVPVPSAIWMIGSGLLGLLGLKRRG